MFLCWQPHLLWRLRFITTARTAPNRGNYRESLLIIVVLSPRSLFLWRRRIGWSVGRTKCQMLAVECVHLLLAVGLHVLLDQKCSPYLNQSVLVTTNQTFHHEDGEETVATDIYFPSSVSMLGEQSLPNTMWYKTFALCAAGPWHALATALPISHAVLHAGMKYLFASLAESLCH